MAEPNERPALREAELEERIRKLESALVDWPRPADDDALADRVIARLSALAAERERDPEARGVMVLASTSEAPPPPQGAVLHPPAPSVDFPPKTWFVANLAAELASFSACTSIRAIASAARPSSRCRGSRLLLIFNYYFFAHWVPIPFLSPVLERLLAVSCGILIYKLLTRELARYREVLAYLARYGAMIRLGVNVDHVATVRQARRASEPDPVAAAVLATLGGADGITVHLREDRRHIQDRDVAVLRETVATRLNLEMATAEEIIGIALRAEAG